MAFAEHSFGLDTATADGSTKRHHLIAAARQTGRRPKALDGPPFPERLRYLWRHFLDIHSGRTINGFSHSKATHLDIWAWQQNSGVRLDPWEVGVVMALGSLWLKVQADAERDKTGRRGVAR